MAADLDAWVWVPFDVDKRFDGFRVDRFLSQRLAAYTRSRVQKILESSRVLRGDQPLKASTKVRGGERILIAYPRRLEEPLPSDAELPVLFEDDDLLIINKPANLLSHPTDKIHVHTVLGLIRHTRPALGPVHLLHRLDRETSGVLALAKTRIAARAWTEAMEGRHMKKEYIALVQGIPSPKKGVIDLPIGRKAGVIKVQQGVNGVGAVSAITKYEVKATLSLTPTPSPDRRGEKPTDLSLSRWERGDPPGVRRVGEASFSVSLVHCWPETGRLHQIRVHMAAMGCPILGDVLYNGDGSLYLKMTRRQLTLHDRETLGFPRLALHAARLTFPHPMTRKTMTVSAPLPADMKAKIAKLSPE